MREGSVFLWQHLLKSFNGTIMHLLNIRTWNVHLELFLSDKIHQSYPNLFCCKINGTLVKHIEEVLNASRESPAFVLQGEHSNYD